MLDGIMASIQIDDLVFREIELEKDKNLYLRICSEIDFISEKRRGNVDPDTILDDFHAEWIKKVNPIGDSFQEAALKELEYSLKEEGTICEFIEYNNERIGFIWLDILSVKVNSKTIAIFNRIWIAPEYRKQGIAKKMLDTNLIERTKQLGIDVIRSQVDVNNIESQRLNETLGAKPIKIIYEKRIND